MVMSDSLRIRAAQESDALAIREFADRNIGVDYFSLEKVQTILQSSQWLQKIMCSFVLEDVEQRTIEGIRLTYPPGQWPPRHPSQPIHPQLWKVPLHEVAYFQSLFISLEHQNRGWGRRLSMASVEILRQTNARAVVCHSWDESPANSSRRYLDGLGFQPVTSVANFWRHIDYECTRCGRGCRCTATEMILYI